MRYIWFFLAGGVAVAACEIETTGGSSGAGGAGAGSDGAAGSVDAGGSGGSSVDWCPEVCAKLDTLFASFGPGCVAKDCACKPACAEVFETNIECIPPGYPGCTCSAGGELDCGNLCHAETQAANDCYMAN